MDDSSLRQLTAAWLRVQNARVMSLVGTFPESVLGQISP